MPQKTKISVSGGVNRGRGKDMQKVNRKGMKKHHPKLPGRYLFSDDAGLDQGREEILKASIIVIKLL